MWKFFESCWEQRPTVVGATALSSPLSRTTTHHHHNPHWKQKKHLHHDCHDPLASSGSNLEVSAIAVRRAIDHNDSDAVMYFLSMKLTNSLFYSLLFYVHRLGGRAGGQKVRFLCYFIVLFLFRWFDTMRTDLSYPPIPFFSVSPPVLILF